MLGWRPWLVDTIGQKVTFGKQFSHRSNIRSEHIAALQVREDIEFEIEQEATRSKGHRY